MVVAKQMQDAVDDEQGYLFRCRYIVLVRLPNRQGVRQDDLTKRWVFVGHARKCGQVLPALGQRGVGGIAEGEDVGDLVEPASDPGDWEAWSE